MRKALNSSPAAGNPVTRKHVRKALKAPFGDIPNSTSGTADGATLNSILGRLRDLGLLENLNTVIKNGSFGQGASPWVGFNASIAAVDGKLQVTATTASGQGARQTFAVISGHTYQVSAGIVSNGSGYARVTIYDGTSLAVIGQMAGPGTFSFTATSASAIIALEVASLGAWGPIGTVAIFDDISVA